jgi:metallo-beta-lactamase class B
MTFIRLVSTATAALVCLAGTAMAQDYPPYPEQRPLSPGRQGPIAEGMENTPNGGRPEINSVDDMLEVSGYTAPLAIRYATLAALQADGEWGTTLFYRCKNTPGGTALNAPYPQPLEVFDGVYSIGNHANNIWAIETSDGIILLDTLGSEADAHAFIVGNMMRLGLDPEDIALILVSHGHGDHTGGVNYLRELSGARIAMPQIEWEPLAERGAMPEMAEGDFYLTDGMEITVGDRTLTAVMTPGHTPGTISLIIPVTWNGEAHMATYGGGQGSPNDIPRLIQFRDSLDHLSAYHELMGVDVLMSNHTIGDDGLTRIAQMVEDPSVNPYIVGKESVANYHEMWQSCLTADVHQRLYDGQEVSLDDLIRE